MASDSTRFGGEAEDDVCDGPYIEHVSTESFPLTLARVLYAIEAVGLTVFARIDHATNADTVGLRMPPTVVIVYGNARGGTVAMHAAPRVALDLPLRVLVREDEEGRVFVAYRRIAPLLCKAGVPAGIADGLARTQQLITQHLITKAIVR